MSDSIETQVNSFSNFLTEKKSTLKNNPNNFLISYSFPIDNFNIDCETHSLVSRFNKTFYFEIPADNFSFIGIDEAISISEKGEGRFAATEKKINEWKENFINNWEMIDSNRIPLFIGSIKFMVEHSDDDWKEFDDADWVVPEFVFLNIDDKKYLIYNFVFSGNSSTHKAVEKFESRLNNILNALKKDNDGAVSFSVLKEIGFTPKDKKKWKQLIEKALDEIREGKIEKIVLSRKVEFLLSNEPEIEILISQLKHLYPRCYIFAINHNKSFFFGATPEKLARFIDGRIETEALAGSASRGINEEEDKILQNNLMKSDKDLREHNFVVNHIRSVISNYSSIKIDVDSPSVRKLAHIQHLLTKFALELNNGSPVLSIIKDLSPTPAVCGIPVNDSLRLIKKLETHNRGLYSGIIGWLNFDNEGEFAVAIRSAILNKKKITAFAGCGIVHDSDPDLEYAETELKLKTIHQLLKNENKN